eukprot:3621295-Rhodomonas_salina.1
MKLTGAGRLSACPGKTPDEGSPSTPLDLGERSSGSRSISCAVDRDADRREGDWERAGGLKNPKAGLRPTFPGVIGRWGEDTAGERAELGACEPFPLDSPDIESGVAGCIVLLVRELRRRQLSRSPPSTLAKLQSGMWEDCLFGSGTRLGTTQPRFCTKIFVLLGVSLFV